MELGAKMVIRSRTLMKAHLKVETTARKYASLQTEFAQAVKRFKANGQHVSRHLISRMETARHNYEKAMKKEAMWRKKDR